MGIKAARAKLGKAEAKPNVIIELDGEPLTFREPKSTDLSLPSAAEKVLKGMFPFMPHNRRIEVNMLARCYVPAPEETEMKALEEFGGLSEDQDRKFTDILIAFTDAYPEFTNWLKAKEDAKND